MTPHPDIVFFDMDHTLIDNDCDVSWKDFLIAEGLAPEKERAANYRYWELYAEGNLPEEEFIEFQLRQFKDKTPEEMRPLTLRHYEKCVLPKVYAEAHEEIARWRATGASVVMLTATNRAVAEPVCNGLGLDDLVCTEIETHDGRYTGKIEGLYCIGDRKPLRAEQWAKPRGLDIGSAVYYGDSASDIPMLERVETPYCVNPHERLRVVAEQRDWRILRWSRNHD